jgi:hypothetical protein
MKKKEKITFEDDDCFALEQFSKRLESFINVEHDYVEGSLVLSLNAGFGCGKTTFIDMWQSSLLDRRAVGQFVPMPIILNAWESDHCGDPLLAILVGLVAAVEQWQGTDAPDEDAFKKAAKDVGWFALGLANEIAAKLTGLNAVKIGDLVEKKKGERTQKNPDFIELYQQRMAALKALKAGLESAFGGATPKVLVFVDELDRCRPDYAVSFLETIKHVFDVEGMVFIFAVDYAHLSGSAKALYGSELKFEDYFRKFFHRSFSLPSIDETACQKLAERYVEKYLRVEGKRSSIMKLDRHLVERIVELAVGLRMPPRQIQEAFRILGHTLSTENQNMIGELGWCISAGTILLTMLRTAAKEVYEGIGRGSMSHEEVGHFLIDKLGFEETNWWFHVYLTGILNESNRNLDADIEAVLRKLKFVTGEYNARDVFSKFTQGWGMGRTGIKKIHRRIETAESF